MAMRSSLDVSLSRQGSLDDIHAIYAMPGAPARPQPADVVIRLGAKFCLPPLWLAMFSSDDLLRIELPQGTTYRSDGHPAELTSWTVGLAQVGAGITRLQARREFLLSLWPSPAPDLSKLCDAWIHAMESYPDAWATLDYGDIFDGDEIALPVIRPFLDGLDARDNSLARHELVRQLSFDDPDPYVSDATDQVRTWYAIFSGFTDVGDLVWPPEPFASDIALAGAFQKPAPEPARRKNGLLARLATLWNPQR